MSIQSMRNGMESLENGLCEAPLEEIPKEYIEDKPVMVFREGKYIPLEEYNKKVSHGRWKARKVSNRDHPRTLGKVPKLDSKKYL